ncbi:hypothetical protein ACP70R_008084 [Stipagrostis hirtigluma subsp. patula]
MEAGDGRNKRCRVATGSSGKDGDGTGEYYHDGDSDVDGALAEETADAGGESSDGTGEDYIYEDDDSSCDDGEVPAAAEQRYVVLTEADVRARQETDMATVAEVLSIPSSFAAVLLRHYKWLPARVQEEWFSDDRRVRDAVGLLPDGVPVPMALSRRRLSCAICFTRFSAGRMRSAGCSHFYCGECWRGYIRAAVDDGARCLSLRCPDTSCSAAVVRELVDEVADGEDKARYAGFALRSYVEESGGRIKWCPAPGCTRALEFTGSAADATADVFCSCRHGFCFRCGEEAHRPVPCDTVRAWLAKNVSDSENANWLLTNTKHCPKCRRPIEKNHGCNHMTCRTPCRHQFCWICLDPWKNHRRCSRYQQPDYKPDAGGKLAVTKEERRRRQAKASLDRYLYHYERWAANLKSLQKALADMDELKHSWLENMAGTLGVVETDLGFIAEAYEQIVGCRRVLRWAYAYGYYLDPERDAGKRALFDELQNHANMSLERLHRCAEQERVELCAAEPGDAVMEMYGAYKEKLARLTKVTGQYFGNLVKAFENDLAWPIPSSD